MPECGGPRCRTKSPAARLRYPRAAGGSGGIFLQHARDGHPGGQRRRLPRRRVLRAAPAATSPPASNPGATRQGNLSCWRKTAAEADCGLPSGGADYADTICLNYDAIVAGRIDRGATNGLTRGSAMFCTVAAYRGVLQLKFNGNYRKRPIKSLVLCTFSFLRSSLLSTIEDFFLRPAVSVLLLFASLPDCSQNQTAVSDTLRLFSDF